MSYQRWGILTAAVTIALTIGTAVGVWAVAGETNPKKIEVRVDSVLASDTNQGVDVRLTPMGPRLHSLFNYTTYHLVSRQHEQTPIGSVLSFDLPGGRILHIEPQGMEGDMIAMDLVLFQGERPMMSTELKLRNHGVMLVGGPRYEQGMLIISISADCRCSRGSEVGAAPQHQNPSPEAALPQ
jgi:hypothetical protein